jgi:hypothetical protein
MERYELEILRRLLKQRCIWGKHTSIEQSLRGLRRHEWSAGRYFLEKLVKAEFVIMKKAHYGDQVSINPERLKEIKSILAADE